MADTESKAEEWIDITDPEDEPGGLMKQILVEGRDGSTPTPGSQVSVHYVGTLEADGTKFDSSRDRGDAFDFKVGVGQVIKGWDTGICSMKKGEKCILRCRGDYAYGDRGSPPKIGPNATLDFEVELFTWKEELKEPGQMSKEERIAFATKMKLQGNESFKAKQFSDAAEAYAEGAKYITYEEGGHGHGHSHGDGEMCHGDHGEEKAEEAEEGKDAGHDHGHGQAAVDKAANDKAGEEALALACLNNCAAARLKTGDVAAAVQDCGKAIEIDAANIKAFFRRSQAFLALGDFKKSGADAAKCLELDPDNKAAAKLQRKIVSDMQKEKKKEKAMYSKMFK